MAQLDDLLPEISPEAPGAPEPSIIIAARNAVIEFCEKSLYWAAQADPVDIEAGVHTYDLDSPESDSIVAGVLLASHDGTPLDRVSEDQLDLDWPSYQNKYRDVLRYGLSEPWRQVTATKPCMYLCPTPREIRLVGIPEASLTGGLTMKVGVKPNPQSEEFGEVLYEDYHEALAWGALYRLLMQPSKAWSNPQAATTYKVIFDQKINEAKGRRLASFTRQDTVTLRSKTYYK